MNFNKSTTKLHVFFHIFHYFEIPRRLKINSVGVDPRTTTFEEINEIKGLILHGLQT